MPIRLSALLRWLPAVLWMAVIFGLSSMPIDDISDNEWIATLTRKGGHVAVFGTLALFVWWALPEGRWRPHVAFLITALYGISDEIHQTFVPPRVGSPIDALIDATGAAIALFILVRYQSRATIRTRRGPRPGSRPAAMPDSQ